jgi:predicted RNA-binding protein with PUA-like domain
MAKAKKTGPNLWLFKEEPSHYSYADFERDGETNWTGVSNALALKHLRNCTAGDRVFYYHTGNEKAIVAIATVIAPNKPQDQSTKDVAVTIRPWGWLKHPVSLARIKSEKSLSGWELARISRLSIMPVTLAQWRKVMELSAKPS